MKISLPCRARRLIYLAAVLTLPTCLHAVDLPADAAKTLEEQPGILTPKAGPAPHLNGPKVHGERPGFPFLYTIPATGTRPMTFTADGLPAGLKLDEATGQITGSVHDAGEFQVTLHASNVAGKAEKPFRIVIGDKIALTPPMGWNSWNCWGESVSQAKVLSSAKAMVDKGLNEHGWSFINIDDGWQAMRGGDFNGIQPNGKFPAIKELADDVHSMGLKFGIYSSPWALTYAGHVGSGCYNEDGTYDWIKAGNHTENYHITKNQVKKAPNGKVIEPGKPISFAVQDAKQWAAWGVDYLKYDWYVNDVESTETMDNALRAAGRDVVFSLSNSAPFEQASDWKRLANAWRTTGDIVDTWKSVYDIGFQQQKWAPFAGPGHWNDPDMLVVGNVGWGNPHPTRLTHNEQYSHISLWCLLSAPLLIGCDIATMDDFTVSLLTNDEVLDVDQDALGIEATPVVQNKDFAIYAKPLEDGTVAVGLFNLGSAPQKIAVTWSDLKLAVPQRVRDLWRQKDVGIFPEGFSSEIGTHGAMLIRVSPADAKSPQMSAGAISKIP